MSTRLLYKKQAGNFRGGNMFRERMALRTADMRKESRSKLLNEKRNLCELSQVREMDPSVENGAPKLSKRELLKKWKEEKSLRRAIDAKNKRPPFKVSTSSSKCSRDTLPPSSSRKKIIPRVKKHDCVNCQAKKPASEERPEWCSNWSGPSQPSLPTMSFVGSKNQVATKKHGLSNVSGAPASVSKLLARTNSCASGASCSYKREESELSCAKSRRRLALGDVNRNTTDSYENPSRTATTWLMEFTSDTYFRQCGFSPREMKRWMNEASAKSRGRKAEDGDTSSKINLSRSPPETKGRSSRITGHRRATRVNGAENSKAGYNLRRRATVRGENSTGLAHNVPQTPC
ncbi:uncharacterized protein LOC135388398 [Ornithodoros turicata]|uniref:uncharacterized protein LOC135388398 n=1 Tax=Ornithodoros turicata TaxID=34597 RepID=UPI00313A15C3